MKWLQGLMTEVEKITELNEPETERAAGQTIIGELPDNLKRLYSYCKALADKVQNLRKESDETDSRKAAAEIRGIAKRLDTRMTIAVGILWEEIRHEFRDHIKPSAALDICKGWKVCTSAPCDCLLCKMTRQAADGSK